MAYGLGLIYSMRLDDGKGIQSVKSAWSKYSQSLKPAPNLLGDSNGRKKKNIYHFIPKLSKKVFS